jgi:hypothetical protein
MNLPELAVVGGSLARGIWGFSVAYHHGPGFGLLGGAIGVALGLAGAAVVVLVWVGSMALWGRSKVQDVLPKAVSGLIVLLLTFLALGGGPLLLVLLAREAVRAAGLARGG